MHDPFDNPEVAAASQVLRGATGKPGRADRMAPSNVRTPRAVTRRGVRVFAAARRASASSRQAPTCPHRAVPAVQAGLRIVET